MPIRVPIHNRNIDSVSYERHVHTHGAKRGFEAQQLATSAPQFFLLGYSPFRTLPGPTQFTALRYLSCLNYRKVSTQCDSCSLIINAICR